MSQSYLFMVIMVDHVTGLTTVISVYDDAQTALNQLVACANRWIRARSDADSMIQEYEERDLSRVIAWLNDGTVNDDAGDTCTYELPIVRVSKVVKEEVLPQSWVSWLMGYAQDNHFYYTTNVAEFSMHLIPFNNNRCDHLHEDCLAIKDSVPHLAVQEDA